jgi:hypothetical protein
MKNNTIATSVWQRLTCGVLVYQVKDQSARAADVSLGAHGPLRYPIPAQLVPNLYNRAKEKLNAMS